MQAIDTTQTLPMNQQLIKAALDVRENAYAPYSKYKVGAALCDMDGNIHTGCNMENASFGLTNCAERSAIAKAIAAGQREFLTIAIVANAEQAAPWPCGACRQVLHEFSPDIKLIIADETGRILDETKKLSDIFLCTFSLGS